MPRFLICSNMPSKRLNDRNLARQINWPKFLQAVEEQSGAPVDISR